MCDDCHWAEAQALAEDLAERGSDFAQRMLDTWFAHPLFHQAPHVTDAQRDALARTRDAFDAWDEGQI
jgi:hypothetical protein